MHHKHGSGKRIYNKFEHWSVEDCDCKHCQHYAGKGKPCPLEKCCIEADAITACFSEYSKRVMEKGTGKPSILKQLEKFADLIKSIGREPKQRDRAREAAQHER